MSVFNVGSAGENVRDVRFIFLNINPTIICHFLMYFEGNYGIMAKIINDDKLV